MTTLTERPDLTELILDATSADVAIERLKDVVAQDPAYVAYFATGSADNNIEEALSLCALLGSAGGTAALKEALDRIIRDHEIVTPSAPDHEALGERFIRISVCSHGEQPHVEICDCGETNPNAMYIAEVGTAGVSYTTCGNCGRQRNHVTEEITTPEGE